MEKYIFKVLTLQVALLLLKRRKTKNSSLGTISLSLLVACYFSPRRKQIEVEYRLN